MSKRSEHLWDALTRVDDDILAEASGIDSADKLKNAKISSSFGYKAKNLISIAACLVIILITAISIPNPNNAPSAENGNVPSKNPAESPAESVMNIITTPEDGIPPAASACESQQAITTVFEECCPELAPSDNEAGRQMTYTLKFEAPVDIREFLSAAKAQKIAYDDFLSKHPTLASLPQGAAEDIADKMTNASGHVCIKTEYSFRDYYAEYISDHSGNDCFSLLVTLNGTKYSFYHRYDSRDESVQSNGSFAGTFFIDDVSIDLYLSGGKLHGYFIYNEMLISVCVEADTPTDDIFDAFEIVKFVEARG